MTMVSSEPSDLIVGIDDATRCPVVGSLVCVGVMIQRNELKFLQRLGVKDSKTLSYSKIVELANVIPKFAKIEMEFIDAEKISKSIKEFNLNDMECVAYCNIAKKFIDNFSVAQVQLNNFDRNRDKFIWRAEKLGFKFDWNKWLIEHNNESRDIAVGGASIIAKSLSLQEYEKLRILCGDFGSGNPNDEKTKKYLKEHKKHKGNCKGCKIIRWNWGTLKKV